MKLLTEFVFLAFFVTAFYACSWFQDEDDDPPESLDYSWVADLPALDLSKPHRILCLGNSITLHAENDDVGWYSRHGMAASSPDRDYVHQLQSLIRIHNENSEVIPVSMGFWERDYSKNLDSIISTYLDGVDVIIVRLGENMDDNYQTSDYEIIFDTLFRYSKQHASYVMATGLYWTHYKKELGCLKAAKKNGVKVAQIDWIFQIGEPVSPQIGDTIMDVNGLPYTVTSEFIVTHPNDRGMKMIAQEIYKILVGEPP